MAEAIQFTVPSNDFIELTGAGANGSLHHQGSLIGVGSSIILVEAAIKPAFDADDPNRFQTTPVSIALKSGGSESYFDAITLWAVSARHSQLLTVTPSA